MMADNESEYEPKDLDSSASVKSLQLISTAEPVSFNVGGFVLFFLPQGKKKRRKREKLQDSNTGKHINIFLFLLSDRHNGTTAGVNSAVAIGENSVELEVALAFVAQHL